MIHLIAALALVGADEPAMPLLDPSCMAAVAWVVDPEAKPIQIFGCRESSEIPAPDANGWVRHNIAGGGYVWAKMGAVNADSVWTFQVQYNGGGSGTFEYVVHGEPDMKGIIQSPKVEALPGD